MAYRGFRCTDEDWYRQEGERSKAQGPPNLTLRWLLHPVCFMSWRADVRREGPFAPTFNEWRSSKKAARQGTRSTGAAPER